MRAFDLLALLDKSVTPSRSKLHLAMSNGRDDPLTLFRAGRFEEWQAWQTRRNFERDLVVAMIRMSEPDRWLFGGVYGSLGCKPTQPGAKEGFIYDLAEVPTCRELRGRLVMSFARPGRQSYLNAETWSDAIELSHILPEALGIQVFPGFKAVNVSKMELDAIIERAVESWRVALSSVGGVYLITDRETGRLYVGSAYGEGGFWQRWTAYAECGHGGNVELREIVRECGIERCASFHYSILEIADPGTKPDDVIARETHWKSVLGTRDHGLNSN